MVEPIGYEGLSVSDLWYDNKRLKKEKAEILETLKELIDGVREYNKDPYDVELPDCRNYIGTVEKYQHSIEDKA